LSVTVIDADPQKSIVSARKLDLRAYDQGAPFEVLDMSVKEMQQQPFGRPPKKASIGRKKFTTYVKADLIKKLKIKAIKEGKTAADLLEKILTDYLK
jgi:hypothetical protein